MTEATRSPAILFQGFVNSLLAICNSSTSVLRYDKDVIVGGMRTREDGVCITTITNDVNDVSIDVMFNEADALILFAKYRINPYLLHRNCKIITGDTASLSLKIPMGSSERIVSSTLEYLSQLVYDCFNRNNFTLK